MGHVGARTGLFQVGAVAQDERTAAIWELEDVPAAALADEVSGTGPDHDRIGHAPFLRVDVFDQYHQIAAAWQSIVHVLDIYRRCHDLHDQLALATGSSVTLTTALETSSTSPANR